MPNELEIALAKSGLDAIAETGVIYNLFADRWERSTDMDVNYMLVAGKPDERSSANKPRKGGAS